MKPSLSAIEIENIHSFIRSFVRSLASSFVRSQISNRKIIQSSQASNFFLLSVLSHPMDMNWIQFGIVWAFVCVWDEDSKKNIKWLTLTLYSSCFLHCSHITKGRRCTHKEKKYSNSSFLKNHLCVLHTLFSSGFWCSYTNSNDVISKYSVLCSVMKR